jgi:hypothetical protein
MYLTDKFINAGIERDNKNIFTHEWNLFIIKNEISEKVLNELNIKADINPNNTNYFKIPLENLQKYYSGDRALPFWEFNSFNDFFEEYSFTDKYPDIPFQSNKISSYCHSRKQDGSFLTLYVKPKQFIINWIKENMLNIGYDNLYFEIVEHDDGKALLLIHYNLIIGSRWLTKINIDSIPTKQEENK